MRRCSALVGAALCVALIAGCEKSPPRPRLTVFAAASLAGLVGDAADAVRASGVDVVVTTGGSSMLARQIERGAPADLFLSANRAWVDHVVACGRADGASRRVFASNRLVVVVPAGAGGVLPTDPSLPGLRRIALADPDAVPAGVYARRAFETRDAWAAVAPRAVPVQDVRAALRLAATGAVDAAVVYATDARTTDTVVVAPVDLPVAGGIAYELVARTDASDAAALFAATVGEPARLARFGFAPAR